MAIPDGDGEFRALLPQSMGYGVVVGIGFAFAALMLALTHLQKRFTNANPQSAAEFASAGRSVKPGLIAAGVVSAWTWSATLLQSSTSAYQLGLSAAWWYAAGGAIQVLMFAAVAAKVKQNANGATTFLQIVKARYGTATHLLFTFYALACFHVVAASLVLGCAATVNALTGMNVVACCFLLPIGIAVYILFAVLYTFAFSTFATSDAIGSPSKLWDLLAQAAVDAPVPGNYKGSYLTMQSNDGLVFAANSIVAGFAGVFCDQSYWQRAIASRPESTTKAYMLGGLSWFAIPLVFGTSMGLAARGLVTNPAFPTYPYGLSASQQSAGLAAPAAAVVLLGKGGAAAVLLIVFMAATSAMSAELIACSSIITYDLIGVYVKPLTGPQVVTWSHGIIALLAVWMGVWSVICNYAGIDLGWLYYFQGTICSPAVVSIGLTVCWKRQSRVAALYGTLLGAVCGMVAWFVSCWKIYGVINIPNLSAQYSALASCLTGLVVSGAAVLVLTWLCPDPTDAWAATRAISGSDNVKTDHNLTRKDAARQIPDAPADADEADDEKKAELDGRVAPVLDEESAALPSPLDHAALQRTFVRAGWFSVVLTLLVVVVIPMPLYGCDYIYSPKFFAGWVGVGIAWLLLAGCVCILMPLWESRVEIGLIVKGLCGAGRA